MMSIRENGREQRKREQRKEENLVNEPWARENCKVAMRDFRGCISHSSKVYTLHQNYNLNFY
jgi:hypothetical protein